MTGAHPQVDTLNLRRNKLLGASRDGCARTLLARLTCELATDEKREQEKQSHSGIAEESGGLPRPFAPRVSPRGHAGRRTGRENPSSFAATALKTERLRGANERSRFGTTARVVGALVLDPPRRDRIGDFFARADDNFITLLERSAREGVNASLAKKLSRLGSVEPVDPQGSKRSLKRPDLQATASCFVIKRSPSVRDTRSPQDRRMPARLGAAD